MKLSTFLMLGGEIVQRNIVSLNAEGLWETNDRLMNYGIWICSNCAEVNNAERNECKKCREEKFIVRNKSAKKKTFPKSRTPVLNVNFKKKQLHRYKGLKINLNK